MLFLMVSLCYNPGGGADGEGIADITIGIGIANGTTLDASISVVQRAVPGLELTIERLTELANRSPQYPDHEES